jgi:uncharacterized membrane protein
VKASRDDRHLALEVGGILRIGVIVSSAVIVSGLVPFIVREGLLHADYHVFRGEPAAFRSVSGAIVDAARADPRGIMQLGVLLLVATPFARVALCVVEFARAKDRLYVAVALLVLLALSWGLLGSG